MIRNALAALMLCLLPLFAQAQALTGVSASPTVAYVQGTGAGLITVRWTLELTVSSDQTVTVTSSGGTLNVGAQPPVSTGGVLRRTVRLTTGTTTVRITERLRIDRTSARYILEGSTGSFGRVFTDSLGGTGTSSVGIAARASGSGGLTLQNLDLAFDDGATFRTVSPGEALTARASVSTSGRGLIKGKWEIAGPTGGFRVLSRASLTAGGPRRTVVESPLLPTDRAGSFRVRFSIDGDGERFGDPLISYTVGSGQAAAAIALTAPQEGAALGTRTRFAWEPVAGADRYRIEFLGKTDLRPLAAVETAGTSATVRSFTLERVLAVDGLLWRVLALDAAGQEIGRSAQRRIGAP